MNKDVVTVRCCCCSLPVFGRFKGTWRRTTLLPREKEIPTPYAKIPVPGFHSNYLYTRWCLPRRDRRCSS